ncbi:hypothetical protein ACYX7E_14660 [Luteimonas sp. RIT-PG2_3]
MPSAPPALDDADAIARFGEDLLLDIERLALPALLMASPLSGIADSIASIRDALLADDPAAARRRTGWWGRLLGNDIEQQARAEQLAADLPWWLVRAREQLASLDRHVEDLDRSHAALSTLLARMQAGIDAAARQHPTLDASDPLQAMAAPATRLASRLAHLGKLHLAHQLSLSHLDHQRSHLRLLQARYRDTLQQLAPLAAQQAMLRDGRRQQMVAAQARQALAGVEQVLAATADEVALQLPTASPPHADAGAAIDASNPTDRSTLPSTDARNEHEH